MNSCNDNCTCSQCKLHGVPVSGKMKAIDACLIRHEQIEVPKNLFQVSGSRGGTGSDIIIPNTFLPIQLIDTIIPPKNSLIIKKTRFHFGDQRNRLAIDTDPIGGTYISTSNEGEETPTFVLFTNGSDLPILVTINIYFHNPANSGGDANTFRYDGWWVDFTIE
ncbi:hypothetical protein [Lysinibacillus xylanilyticus]|uniref:Uncharacterized protein n=1 Tax=Lysinibacillus xylanilyticus TaxID=582475 RepID=A0ABV3VXB2_9BACI